MEKRERKIVMSKKGRIRVFTGGDLFDATDGNIKGNSVVIIEDGRFSKVGVKGNIQLPAGEDVEIIDTTGKTVLPGLIETHCITAMIGDAGPNDAAISTEMNKMEMLMRGVSKLRACYHMGFTSIREGGSGWGWYEVALRDAIKRGDVDGPRYQAVGYHITVSGGHSCYFPYHIGRHRLEETAGCFADGPDEWRKAARMNIWNKTDYVKVVCSSDLADGVAPIDPTTSQATQEEINAAVEEAHRANRKVIAHCEGKTAIMKAINAGVNIITHGFWMDEECAELMAANNIFWEPTNAYARNQYWGCTNQVPEEWLDVFGNYLPESCFERSINNWEDKQKNFKKLIKNTGVKVLLGSDTGAPWVWYGENAQELEANVELGQSTKDALFSCTKWAAESCGWIDEVGTIEEGKCADIVIVNGNPLENISVLLDEDKIQRVIKDGEDVVYRPEPLKRTLRERITWLG